ncbi:phosphatidylinositol N-acetylglucosaminyltransferase [Synchytrium endobioticum]|uniref:Phosphatidylinositol N-acetylglucosaminyltransferase n=1 Tax=Synchytrium endobioticum TaxID=286115 RepID=A0A507CLA4_9FUNG|nr:phosphatidylinositol N-acetylglucosaminyltransferase [Synchytrium endobioticum]TPX38835.1 phosphatidylinositol N-acetylglucosaminyltransferase [Synchytrium endobioticum]
MNPDDPILDIADKKPKYTPYNPSGSPDLTISTCNDQFIKRFTVSSPHSSVHAASTAFWGMSMVLCASWMLNDAYHHVVLVVGFLMMVGMLMYLNSIMDESLLVMRDIGIQLETRRLYHLLFPSLPSSSRFIPAARIQNMLIHEGIQTCRVRYILIVMLKDADKLVIIFSNLLPRLDILRTVAVESKALLRLV